MRAYADIAQNLTEAGYSDSEVAALQKEVDFYSDTRAAIKKHSGEELDIKAFEADMRHLLNTYVQADPATDLGNLNSLSLTELIIETGIHDAIARKLNEKGNLSRNAIAEGIINNVRKTIIRDQLTDPRFYAEMSKLLDDLIKQSREWHKTLLHEEVPKLISKWERKLMVEVRRYFLQRMKTKWGSCNHRAGHIRLNTELVKKPKDLLEYVIVHEMAHLIEPIHSDRFVAILQKHCPTWREARAELNELPLTAEVWNE